MKKRKKKKIGGLAPGTLIRQKSEISDIRQYVYTKDSIDIHKGNLETILSSHFKDIPRDANKWISVTGCPGDDDLKMLEKYAGIHPIILSSIQDSDGLTRMEDQGSYIFVAMPHYTITEAENSLLELENHDVFFFLSKEKLVSIYTGKANVFKPVEERLLNSGGRVRNLDEDYLLYALLEVLTEFSVETVEMLRHKAEELESDVFDLKNPLPLVRKYRNSARELRHVLLPIRELFTKLKATESNLINDSLAIFYGDLLDHGLRLMSDLDRIQDHLTMITELYMSHLSNETNKTMKVLTIVSAIFIPLSFIAGVFGMNFDNMPQLHHPLGYAVTIGSMFLVACVMLIFFKWKKWL